MSPGQRQRRGDASLARVGGGDLLGPGPNWRPARCCPLPPPDLSPLLGLGKGPRSPRPQPHPALYPFLPARGRTQESGLPDPHVLPAAQRTQGPPSPASLSPRPGDPCPATCAGLSGDNPPGAKATAAGRGGGGVGSPDAWVPPGDVTCPRRAIATHGGGRAGAGSGPPRPASPACAA